MANQIEEYEELSLNFIALEVIFLLNYPLMANHRDHEAIAEAQQLLNRKREANKAAGSLAKFGSAVTTWFHNGRDVPFGLYEICRRIVMLLVP